MKILLSTAYWPNLLYFFHLLSAEEVLIEAHENYQKQSFRNRCQILSANGMLELQIPVKHQQHHQQISEIEISYTERWQVRHWRALESAYRNSPWFEFFESDIAHFYNTKFDRLLDYNTAQLKVILKLIRSSVSPQFTQEYQASGTSTDLRNLIHPKKEWRINADITRLLLHPYYQTFSEKFGFVPNLSVLDLLFNTGLQGFKLAPEK